jgi:hypothetical protein
MQVLDITWAISRLRGKVGGGKDQGLQSPRDAGANIVPADGALSLQSPQWTRHTACRARSLFCMYTWASTSSTIWSCVGSDLPQQILSTQIPAQVAVSVHCLLLAPLLTSDAADLLLCSQLGGIRPHHQPGAAHRVPGQQVQGVSGAIPVRLRLLDPCNHRLSAACMHQCNSRAISTFSCEVLNEGSFLCRSGFFPNGLNGKIKVGSHKSVAALFFASLSCLELQAHIN